MNYRVRVTRTAARQLAKRLPDSVTAACVEFLFEGHSRARRVEYCVRRTIDDGRSEVIVLDISHRRDAYRRPPPRAPARSQ